MKKLLFILCCILSTLTFAQQNTITYFNKTYGGSDTIHILAQAAVPIDSGYMVLGGYTDATHRALYSQKIDLQGNLQWRKDFETGTPGDFTSLSVIEYGAQVLKDGNYLMVVYEKNHNVCFTKLNFAGDTIWSKLYPKIGWQLGKMIVKTPDNGYLIAGMEQNLAADTVKAYSLKVDSLGNFEWDKNYIMGNDARFFTVQYTPWDGGYIFGGMGYSPTTGYDMFVVKTNSVGDSLWSRRYGGIYYDWGAQIVPLTTLQEYQAGQPIQYSLTGAWRDTNSTWEAKLYIAKLNSTGGIIWQQKHANYSYFYNLQTFPIIRQGKRIIGVAGFENSQGFQNPIIVSFSATGDIEWSKPITLDPTKSSYIKDMRPTEDGGYVLAGYQYSSPQTAWVLKIDSLGNTCSFVGCDSTIYTGYPIGLTQIANNNNWSVTPNHSSEQVFITPYFTEKSATFVLYDLLGRAVRQVDLDSGTVQVSVLGLPAGTYFYQIINSQKQILQHDKLIVLH